MLSTLWDAGTRILLMVAGVIVLLACWITGVPDRVAVVLLGGWDLLAIFFVLRQVWIMRRSRLSVDSEAPPEWLLSARWMRRRFGALIIASATGLSSGILIVGLDNVEEWTRALEVVHLLAAAAVVLAWLILHLGYAMHYANIYFEYGEGIRFPGVTGTPNFLDFAYFAFTIGATFATSDVEITNRRVRHAVIWHSVLSFFYNAAVLGIAIGAFTGK